MSQEAATKREKRLAAREQRKQQAAAAQRNARIRQLIMLVLAAALLIGVIVAGVSTQMFGLLNSVAPIGRAVPLEGADHVADGTQVVYQTRPPASGPHYSNWLQTFGYMNPAPPTGNWLHNLEHGAIAILYNCPTACPEIEQELKDLYPQMPLGRNAVRSQPRVLILPYSDMDAKIAVVAWGWILELETVDKDRILAFADQRIDRGPECQNFRCP